MMVLTTAPRLVEGRPIGYLTRTLRRLIEVLGESPGAEWSLLLVDASVPGQGHEELETLAPELPHWIEVVPRPSPPVTDEEARRILEPGRVSLLPEEEVTWGLQITRDFVDGLNLARQRRPQWILRLEDDVEVCRDLVPQLERHLARWPAGIPFQSLFSSRPRWDGAVTPFFCHAQALVFRNDPELDRLLGFVAEHESRNLFDCLLGDYRTSSGRCGRVCYPSLIQHFGESRSQPGSPPRQPLISPTYRDRIGGVPASLRALPAQAMAWLRQRRSGSA